MINFNFTVDDFDAELIIDVMRDYALSQDVEIDKLINNGGSKTNTNIADYIEWHKQHKQHVLDLIKRMKNTRVDSDTEHS